MGQIVGISPGTGGASDPHASQFSMPPEKAAFNRSVATAANAVNQSGILGENREVTFSLDPASRQPVIRVMDIKTNEVITQWPPEYLLQMAADAQSPKGNHA
jgi:uncharacterized FlaG/YvyC family protein